mmetsp:Transcript_20157/g.14871  ORF Transcript_20157/g.14871 Transcript_20157/m.14871 type:complete len:84 (-) Transcript_20157:279-530(-)
MRKKCYYIGYLAVQDQIDSLAEGFHSVIDRNWVRPFVPGELEMLLCGQVNIDLNDWKNNTEYKDYHSYSRTIDRFWKCMLTYN